MSVTQTACPGQRSTPPGAANVACWRQRRLLALLCMHLVLSGRGGHVRYSPATVFALGAAVTELRTARTPRRHRWCAAALAVALVAVSAAPAAANDDTAAAPAAANDDTAAAPAAADDDTAATADHLAGVSACVGAAATDGGFVDVATVSVFAADIGCLAHYRITNGCGDGASFCPTRPLTRWAAALFLARAATVAGVGLSAARETFDDIDDTQPPEGVAAVGAVTAAGIIVVDGAVFDRFAVVTRADMAVFVANFLAVASPTVTLKSGGTYLLGPDRQLPDAVFCDTGGLDERTASAVDAIYELGVTKGRGTGTGECVGAAIYDPSGVVTRAHLAAFLTRALAHTNTRPAGVSAQIHNNAVTVSIRDTDHHPVAFLRTDIFWTPAAAGGEALARRGCARHGVAAAGAAACSIDDDDPRTDAAGNVEVPLPAFAQGGSMWVWAGFPGYKLDPALDTVVRLRLADPLNGAPTADAAMRPRPPPMAAQPAPGAAR